MQRTQLHQAHTRGHADHGWLKSHHTFSFGSYHDPARMHFGMLRVLNDDTVAPGMGFGTHAHDNMEIVSIPLEGELEHRDDMGNVAVIRQGDVQVMSAGTGIRHSEFNRSTDAPVHFLQIWVFPKHRHVAPRYDQVTLGTGRRHNRFQQILSPDPADEGVWIHQDAWFHLGTFDAGGHASHQLKLPGNGIYAFVIKGSITINGTDLQERDGLGLEGVERLDVIAGVQGAELLLMEVPMRLS